MSSATSTAVSRLQLDYRRLLEDPAPYLIATPLPSNILEWHFVLAGPEDTPYEGGYYHGKLVFPSDYPFKPPSIYMITPNGRFEVNTRICLSISDFHPESWRPSWSASSILIGLLSFMVEDVNEPSVGSVESSVEMKRQLARSSLAFNLSDPVFVELFPGMAEVMKDELEEVNQKESSDNSSAMETR